MISQSTKKMIVRVSDVGNVVIYSNLKVFCFMNDLNYHSYKNKKFPFELKVSSEFLKDTFYYYTVEKLPMWFESREK